MGVQVEKTKKKVKKPKVDEEGNPQFGKIRLTLKKEWYDMIENGDKNVEYRELKDYWCRRIKGLGLVCPYAMPSSQSGRKICQKTGNECVSGTQITQKSVVFSYGYTDKTMEYDITTLSVTKGKPEWGAPEDRIVINIGFRK